eukprot:5118707-Alexandrium_andersonii.AAC.1
MRLRSTPKSCMRPARSLASAWLLTRWPKPFWCSTGIWRSACGAPVARRPFQATRGSLPPIA